MNPQGFLALPGVIVAALSLLVPILFFVFRCLCCSWRRKGKGGGCWPTANAAKSIVCSQITSLVLCLFIAVGSVLIYVYGAEATAAVDDFQSQLKDVFEVVDLAFMIAACVFLFFGLVLLISMG